MIPLLVVFFVAPLAQRLRRPRKLLTKDQLINVAATATTLAIMWGTGWGLSHAIERWHEGWGWIGWLVGIIGFPVVFIGAMVLLFNWNSPKQIERRKLTIYRKVAEKPGISYTALCRSVKFDHYEVNRLIRKLLRENRLRCEQRGRVRRYFTQV